MTIGLYHPRALAGDGGITRSVRSLSAAMEELGYPTRVIYDGPTGSSVRDSWVGVKHIQAGPLHVPLDLEEAISGLDVLVLHSAWVSYNVVAGEKAKSLGIPYVLAHRGAYEPRILDRRRLAKRAWWLLFEKRLVEGAAGVHVFFDAQADQVRSLGFDGPLVVAPNGVEVPDDISWDGGSDGALLYVGRFDMEHKGLGTLLDAVAMIPAGRRPHLTLVGPDWRGGKEATAATVERLGLSSWVEVRPPVYGRAKFELMASALGFVYPSLFEAFGNSVAEAASLGVPVLTGRYPLGRYLEARGAGIAVEPNPESMVAGLETLIKPESARLGWSARQAMRPFTWDAVARAWAQQLLTLVPAHA